MAITLLFCSIVGLFAFSISEFIFGIIASIVLFFLVFNEYKEIEYQYYYNMQSQSFKNTHLNYDNSTSNSNKIMKLNSYKKVYEQYLKNHKEFNDPIFVISENNNINRLWFQWSLSMHDNKEQYLRRCRAIEDVKYYQIDYNNLNGLFYGSNSSIYHTTLTSCDCIDFKNRELPCKHIYKLFFMLEQGEPVEDVEDIATNVKQEPENINKGLSFEEVQTKKFNLMLESLTEVPTTVSNILVSKLDVNEIPKITFSRMPKDSEDINNLSDFIVIDVETTGLSPKVNKLIEICAVRFEEFKPVEYMCTFINPKSLIPQNATKINGITNDMVANSPMIGEVAQSFVDFIGNEPIIIGHNVEFDLKFLYSNGINLLIRKRKFLDTLLISKRLLKKYSDYKAEKAEERDKDYDYDVFDYKLTTLIKYYRIYVPQSHRALNDCIATGLLFSELLNDIA